MKRGEQLVTLTAAQAMVALQALAADIADDVSAIQWTVLGGGEVHEVYIDLASKLPAKRAVLDVLATTTHLDAAYLDEMIANRARLRHRDRAAKYVDRGVEPYDVDAAMAIDPATIAPSGTAAT